MYMFFFLQYMFLMWYVFYSNKEPQFLGILLLGTQRTYTASYRHWANKLVRNTVFTTSTCPLPSVHFLPPVIRILIVVYNKVLYSQKANFHKHHYHAKKLPNIPDNTNILITSKSQPIRGKIISSAGLYCIIYH